MTEMFLLLSGGARAAGGFGRGKGPIHLDQVRCTGKEDFLGECPSLGQNVQGCRRREDAGVTCEVAPQESAPPAAREELSCGLRKLEEEEEDGGRKRAEEDVFRLVGGRFHGGRWLTPRLQGDLSTAAAANIDAFSRCEAAAAKLKLI